MAPPPEVCPQCGALVPARVRACPECGSDDQTGWSDHAQAQRLGIPDDEFDYEEFLKEEFGEAGRVKIKPPGLKWRWWLVALGLVVFFLWAVLRP